VQKKIFFLILFSLFALLLFLLIFIRVIDSDELAFLTAANETLLGKVAYRDFFLPQMPLSFFPLLPFARWGMSGFFAGRFFFACLGIIFGLLLFYYLNKRIARISREAIIFLIFVYLANGLFLAWIPLNKPHILVNIFNFLSLLFLYQERLFLSGIFLGLAGETRIIFLLLLPFYLYYIRRHKGKKGVMPFLFGFVLTQGIGLYFFFLAPRNFLTDTVYYHLVRGASDNLGQILANKLAILGKVFFLPQNLLIIITAILAFRYYLPRRQDYQFEFFSLILGGITFIIYYLLISPTHFQYFIQVIPYLIIFVLPYISSLSFPAFSNYRIKLILFFLGFFYILSSIFIIYNYTGNFRPFYQKYHLPLIKKVIDEISRESSPGEKILVFGPNLPVLARRQNLDDYETCPDFPFALRFSERGRRLLNLSSPEEIRRKIQEGIPRLVVGILSERDKAFYKLEELGYKKIREIEMYEIYRR